ncbi:hypothetical protein [Cytophaga aurantiaca]|uniref:hypothetical protein n=1 Tax=Cytophaga aurantiaca TaxID=29530 RepID=UPI00035E26D4|nr:hypothetical protein [Cytophaga aurantiaca]
MNFIPYDKILLTTRQDVRFVQERLIEKTENWQNGYLRLYKNLSEGQYSDPTKFELKKTKNKFTLRRINDRYSNNGLRPIVKGKIANENGTTKIHLTIRQSFQTILFFGFWCFITLFLSLLSFNTNKGISIIVFLFFVVGYSMCLFGYNTEIKYYKRFLLDTFNFDNTIDK